MDKNMDIFGEPMLFNIISQLANLRVEIRLYGSLSIQILMLLHTGAGIHPSVVISHLMDESFCHVSFSK